MENLILLKPLALNAPDGRSTYVVMQGTPTQKQVQEPVRRYLPLPQKFRYVTREVTPLSLASFRSDVLEKTPGDFVDMLYDNGFYIDGKVQLPFAMRLYPASDVRLWRKGELLAISVYPGWVIDDYRILKVFETLPTINGKNVGELRDAHDFVRGYSNLNERKKITPEGQVEIDFEPDRPKQLPQSASRYEGIIAKQDLVAILESAPTDSRGNKLVADRRTSLVIASAPLRSDDLDSLMNDIEKK